MMRHVAGTLLAAFFAFVTFIALACGRIRVSGYWRTWRLLRSGKVVIVSNHPSLAEAFVTAALFWPWQCAGLARLFPWNIADKRLLGRIGEFCYPGMRCIPVDRREQGSGPSRKAAIRAIRQVYRAGGSLIVYPEEGRTCKGERFVYRCGRRVRSCNPNAINIAITEGATIVLAWVEYGDVSAARSVAGDFLKLLSVTLSISFGDPIVLGARMTGDEVAMLLLAS